MKKILFVALLGLMTIANAMAAIDNTPVSMTITLKNGNTVTYAASNMDSVRFVGGKFGDSGAIGMKIYLKGQTQSIDYLYSQITDVVEDTQPVVSSEIFTRVTDVSQLVAGKRYILVYEGNQTHAPAVMGAISNTSTNYGLSVTGNENFAFDNTNGIVQLTEGTSVKVLTLGGTTDAWTFTMDGNSTLCWTSGNSLTTGDSGKDGSNVIISNNNEPARRICYNTGSPRFACYAPGENTGTYSQPFAQLYVEDDGSAASVVAAPTFSPAGGTYTSAQNVTISTTTSGATIYYTTDGSTPSSHSTVYSTPILVSGNMTIKAIAVKGGVSSTMAVEFHCRRATQHSPIRVPMSMHGASSTRTSTPPAATKE